MIGCLATGLLMFGVLAPAVANASTDGAGAAAADHARRASAFTHDQASSASGTAGGTSAGNPEGGASTTRAAHAAPIGTPIALTTISSSLWLFPQILGQVDRHR
jgi:hypothetical protein